MTTTTHATTRGTRLDGITRIGQVNLTEDDVRLLDVDYWADLWARMRLEAVLLNCGGIMAYHPTRLAGHPVAQGVPGRDLFGELVDAARAQGVEVIGRLDVGVVDQRFRDLHPEWMMTDAEGRSRTLNDVTGGTWGQPGGHRLENEMYYSCINSGLFTEYLPDLLSEVVDGYDVAGFFTNGFPTVALAPPSLRMACYCDRCLARWRAFSGSVDYPVADDPSDPTFRQYVRFLRTTALERMRDLVAFTRRLGPGLSFNTSAVPNLGGGLPWNEWARELTLVMCDNQDRSGDYGRTTPSHGLWEVGLSSEVVRSVAAGRPAGRIQSTARLRGGGRHTSKEPAELRLQMAEALAHGELPVWHAVSGKQHNRRWVDGVVEFDAWLAENAEVLTDRRSVADVGIVWSQESAWLQAWGAATPGPAVGDAVAGWHLLLSRCRIPNQLVLADGTESLDGLSALVLPSGLALSTKAVSRVERFVAEGGHLLVVGTAGLVDAWGAPHPGDPVGALVGIRRTAPPPDGFDLVSYLHVGDEPFVRRMLPELAPDEVVAGGNWLVGFDRVDDTVSTAMEWNRSEHMIPTHAAGLPPAGGQQALAWHEDGGRRAFLGADLDARFFVDRATEHRAVLGGLASWALGAEGPTVTVAGDGVVDVRSWHTAHGVAVALVNLDNPGAQDEAVEHFRPVGPLTVRVRGVDPRATVRLTRAAADVVPTTTDHHLEFVVDQVVDFELALLSTEGTA
ncbi:beta-galactosidase trimerization domain-containing protein [Isoptericola sp. AK164]|uniref:beta-galactosidase trimerization domain-containing protein n=1 Tax=Isoptericola sp. AK164 TaxID=3024246 RepID=UPI002418B352|nr:beta-galactosidase trimerization domain-containing protein [Isoptericola sp. AK164]